MDYPQCPEEVDALYMAYLKLAKTLEEEQLQHKLDVIGMQQYYINQRRKRAMEQAGPETGEGPGEGGA